MIVEEKDLKVGELPINKIVLGNALEVLKKFPDNSVDAVVTDPPYGLHFMNQKWDYDVPSVELWKGVLRVMKPGAHLLSFFGTRTYHRGVVNIEDAGFEIRDMIVYLYGSGFPKGQNLDVLIDKELGKYEERKLLGYKKAGLGRNRLLNDDNWKGVGREEAPVTEPATPEAKKWQGWNTTLKPAVEPIVLARKPLSEKNVARNVLKWGTGGLNVEACRVSNEKIKTCGGDKFPYLYGEYNTCQENYHIGRYPANVILDEEAAKMLDEQSGYSKSSKAKKSDRRTTVRTDGYVSISGVHTPDNTYNDFGGASRFFYCAKAGRDERFAYCQDCDKVIPQKEWSKHKDHKVIFHTTVKPLKLMEYLVRLITPPNGIVLDPFFGTGTTGIACLKQGFRFVGIEIDQIYCKIAEHRLKPYLYQKTLEVFT